MSALSNHLAYRLSSGAKLRDHGGHVWRNGEVSRLRDVLGEDPSEAELEGAMAADPEAFAAAHQRLARKLPLSPEALEAISAGIRVHNRLEELRTRELGHAETQLIVPGVLQPEAGSPTQ